MSMIIYNGKYKEAINLTLIQAFAGAFLFVSILAIRVCRKVFNPLTIMCGLWSVIFFLSSLCLFDLRQARIESYIALILGVASFSWGFFVNFFTKRKYRLRIGEIDLNTSGSVELRTKLVWLLLLFSLFFEIANTGRSLSILLSGGSLDNVLSSVRANTADLRGSITNVINNLIVVPFKFAVFPICAYNIANKKNRVMTFFILLLLCAGVISSGGRVFIIYLVVSLCVSFTISPLGKNIVQTTMKIVKKQKRRFVFLIGLMLVVFIFVSLSRSGNRLVQHTYLYFSMQPIMFETWAENISEKGLYGFGEAALNGFTFHILYLIKNIFNIPFPSHWYDVFNNIILVDTSWKPITTSGLPANAYVSAFWYFYLDGRLPGIVLESFIWGWICSQMFKRTVKNPSMNNVCIYSMMLFSVVDSYVRIRFATGEFVGGLLLLCFVLFRKSHIHTLLKIKN